MRRPRVRRRIVVAAFAGLILGVAVYLRFTGLGNGLPLKLARPDEYAVLFNTADIRHDWNPHWWLYPSLFVYLTWAWCYTAHLLFPWLTAPLDYGSAVRVMPGNLLLAGRTLSAVASVATVALTMIVGRGLGGASVALTAGLLVAVNPVVQRDAHGMKADALLSLALLATVAVILRQRNPGRARDGLCLGAAVGAALGMKYSVIAGVFAYAGAVIDGVRGWRRWIPPARLWVAAGVASLIFFVSSLSLLIEHEKARSYARSYSAAVWGVGAPATPENSDLVPWIDGSRLGWHSLDYHLTRSLRVGCGLLAALALLPSLAWALRSRDRRFRIVAVCFLLYLLLIASSSVRLVRYFGPAVPLVVLLLAGAEKAAIDRVQGPRRRAALLVLAALALAVEPGVRAAGYARVASQTDTRLLATEYLTRTVPPGTRVSILGTWIWPFGEPSIPPGLKRLPTAAASESLRPGDVIVTHEHKLKFSHLDPGQLDRVAPCRSELARFSPFGTDWKGSRFEPADAYYIPLAGFRGVERPGPIVTIWQVERCPESLSENTVGVLH